MHAERCGGADLQEIVALNVLRHRISHGHLVARTAEIAQFGYRIAASGHEVALIAWENGFRKIFPGSGMGTGYRETARRKGAHSARIEVHIAHRIPLAQHPGIAMDHIDEVGISAHFNPCLIFFKYSVTIIKVHKKTLTSWYFTFSLKNINIYKTCRSVKDYKIRPSFLYETVCC